MRPFVNEVVENWSISSDPKMEVKSFIRLPIAKLHHLERRYFDSCFDYSTINGHEMTSFFDGYIFRMWYGRSLASGHPRQDFWGLFFSSPKMPRILFSNTKPRRRWFLEVTFNTAANSKNCSKKFWFEFLLIENCILYQCVSWAKVA